MLHMTSPKPVRLCDMRQNSVYDVLVKVQDIRLVHVFKFFYLKIDFLYKKIVRAFMRFAAGVSDFFLKRLFHAEMIHGIVRKFFEYYRHFRFVHAFRRRWQHRKVRWLLQSAVCAAGQFMERPKDTNRSIQFL